MHIKKVAGKVLNEFPELQEQGFNEQDMYDVWKSYQKDVEENLYEPNNLYVQLLNVGRFSLLPMSVTKKKNDMISGINFLQQVKRDDVNYDNVTKKINKIINLFELRISFYNDLKVYLDGYANGKLKSLDNLIEINTKELEQLKEFKDGSYKEFVAKNMAKQSTDSRGNQEQDIQKGTC